MKYGEALGVWEVRIGGGEFDLHPEMGDNRKLMKRLTHQGKMGDTGVMENIVEFTRKMIARNIVSISLILPDTLILPLR